MASQSLASVLSELASCGPPSCSPFPATGSAPCEKPTQDAAPPTGLWLPAASRATNLQFQTVSFLNIRQHLTRPYLLIIPSPQGQLPSLIS